MTTKESWSIDKKIPVTVIGVMLIQTLLVGMGIQKMYSDIGQIKEDQSDFSRKLELMTTEQNNLRQTMTRLDTIISMGYQVPSQQNPALLHNNQR